MHPPLAEAPDRIRWLERADDDFPYYRGAPVQLSGRQWLLVVFAVVIGFASLFLTMTLFRTGLLGFIPAILFVGIPLITLRICAGSGWRALFRRLRGVDFLWMIVFFVLNYAVTVLLAFVVIALFSAESNPAGTILASSGGVEKSLFFVKSAIQLLGEELLVILPMLALLSWLVSRCAMRRTLALCLAMLAVSVGFALVHLPTYQWNFGQALVALVPIRIILLLPYIMTKNIWVSTGTHILNDWAIFGLPLLAGAASDTP